VTASIYPLFSRGPKSSFFSSPPPPTQQLALHLCRLLQPNSDAGLFLPTTLTLPGVDSRDWIPPPFVLYTHPLPHWPIHTQYMAHRIGTHTNVYDGSSGGQSQDQFLLAPSYSDVDVGLIPRISDWPTKGIPWWRAQSTR